MAIPLGPCCAFQIAYEPFEVSNSLSNLSEVMSHFLADRFRSCRSCSLGLVDAFHRMQIGLVGLLLRGGVEVDHRPPRGPIFFFFFFWLGCFAIALAFIRPFI
jgi:hypothetical protein